MAPEFLRDKLFDSRADVYSFGILVWELLAESQPHAHLMPIQCLFQVVSNVKCAF
jgi:serine/threonine protein kinase